MSALVWIEAESCASANNCVNVAFLPDGRVLVRDSKDPDGPRLVFTPAEWEAFISGVKGGEFDSRR